MPSVAQCKSVTQWLLNNLPFNESRNLTGKNNEKNQCRFVTS